MKTPKRITEKLLARLFACPDGLDKFKAAFPKGAAFTPANVRRAKDAVGGGNLIWFASLLGHQDASLTGCTCEYCLTAERVNASVAWLVRKAAAAQRAARKAKALK
jgi:hypothetical protein